MSGFIESVIILFAGAFIWTQIVMASNGCYGDDE